MKQSKTALRRIRMSRCMTQTELAQKLGILPCNISIMEKKGITQTFIAERYAVALNCDPLELLEFSKKPRTCASKQ